MRFDVKIIRVRSPENPVPEQRRSSKPLWRGSVVRSPVGELRHLHDPLRRHLLQWAAPDIQPFLAKFASRTDFRHPPPYCVYCAQYKDRNHMELTRRASLRPILTALAACMFGLP